MHRVRILPAATRDLERLDKPVARLAATAAHNTGTPTENQGVPIPALTLVAVAIKQTTPEPDVSSTETETDTPAVDSTSMRSYYLVRLISAGLFLSAGSLAFGSFVLGALSVYFFLRAYLR